MLANYRSHIERTRNPDKAQIAFRQLVASRKHPTRYCFTLLMKTLYHAPLTIFNHTLPVPPGGITGIEPRSTTRHRNSSASCHQPAITCSFSNPSWISPNYQCCLLQTLPGPHRRRSGRTYAAICLCPPARYSVIDGATIAVSGREQST